MTDRDLLRHLVATVAYRGGKALRDAPDGFATFDVGGSARTPGKLLAHLGDLFAWAVRLADGEAEWQEAPVGGWEDDVARLFRLLEQFEGRLASGVPLACPVERLAQGPVADALTHVGQLMLLRRLAGSRVRSENYFRAEISAGGRAGGPS